MRLLDSNIVIYATKPDYPQVADFLDQDECAISVITRIEVLGYSKLTPDDYQDYRMLLSAMRHFDVDAEIVEKAIDLRRLRRVSLGDAIIASTAMVHRLPLVTHNHGDFSWIPGLELIDPVSA